MKYKISAYTLQELGQRQNQEDSLFPALGQQTDEDRLFILCDGMGGHEKGEVASSTVCKVLSETILAKWNPTEPLSDELLKEALSATYDALDAKDNGEERKMGTTLTFLCLHADGATVAHIGDSRVYQLRPATKKEPARIVFRTQDHSLVNDLVKIGEITEEEAKHHPQKNVITRAMQPCQEHRAKADIAHLTDIRPGDLFYMCSDGMLEEMTDENILFILTKDCSEKEKIEMLRKHTADNKDNHTAHLIRIDKVKGTPLTAPVYVPVDDDSDPTCCPQKKPAFRLPEDGFKRIFPWLFAAAALVCLAVVAIPKFFGDNEETKEKEEKCEKAKDDKADSKKDKPAPAQTSKPEEAPNKEENTPAEDASGAHSEAEEEDEPAPPAEDGATAAVERKDAAESAEAFPIGWWMKLQAAKSHK